MATTVTTATTATTLVDVSDTLRAIENIIDVIQCPTCFVYFNKRWCKNNDTSCFFCNNFVPLRDTYSSIIMEIDWYFINSDEYDHKLFCREFKYNLNKWISEFSESYSLLKSVRSLHSWLYL